MYISTFYFQCYEWALEAMKYVANMKMEKDMSTSDIDKLLSSLELYLTDHEPVPNTVFDSMDKLSTRVENDKLQEQCKVARSRCIETEQLLRIRQSTLKKAKEQIETEEMIEQERRDSVSNLANQNSAGIAQQYVSSSHHNYGPVRYRGGDSPSSSLCGASNYEPSHASSPVGPSVDYINRRRSYAGKPSPPVYSPTAAAFKEHLQGMNLKEHEEYLFYEGLITEDMSDRIVASLPKGLSNYNNVRTSRESLRGSQENMQHQSSSSDNSKSTDNNHNSGGSNASNTRDLTHSSASLAHNGYPTRPKSQYSAINALTGMLNKHSKPHKKMMRRAASCTVSVGDSSAVKARENSGELLGRRDGKSLSMMTTSTDSLPR